MADIEQGLKEAIMAGQAKANEAANAKGIGSVVLPDGTYVPAAELAAGWTSRYANNPQRNGEDKHPPLTAPQIIEHIEALSTSAHLVENIVIELSTALAGRDDSYVQPAVTTDESGTVFDRMGMQLLILTRTIESIEREVKRALGAVKP